MILKTLHQTWKFNTYRNGKGWNNKEDNTIILFFRKGSFYSDFHMVRTYIFYMKRKDNYKQLTNVKTLILCLGHSHKSLKVAQQFFVLYFFLIPPRPAQKCHARFESVARSCARVWSTSRIQYMYNISIYLYIIMCICSIQRRTTEIESRKTEERRNARHFCARTCGASHLLHLCVYFVCNPWSHIYIISYIVTNVVVSNIYRRTFVVSSLRRQNLLEWGKGACGCIYIMNNI